MKIVINFFILLTIFVLTSAQLKSYNEECTETKEVDGIITKHSCDESKFLVCVSNRCQCQDPENQIFTVKKIPINIDTTTTKSSLPNRSRRSPKKGSSITKAFTKSSKGSSKSKSKSSSSQSSSTTIAPEEEEKQQREFVKVWSCYRKLHSPCALPKQINPEITKNNITTIEKLSTVNANNSSILSVNSTTPLSFSSSTPLSVESSATSSVESSTSLSVENLTTLNITSEDSSTPLSVNDYSVNIDNSSSTKTTVSSINNSSPLTIENSTSTNFENTTTIQMTNNSTGLYSPDSNNNNTEETNGEKSSKSDLQLDYAKLSKQECVQNAVCSPKSEIMTSEEAIIWTSNEEEDASRFGICSCKEGFTQKLNIDFVNPIIPVYLSSHYVTLKDQLINKFSCIPN